MAEKQIKAQAAAFGQALSDMPMRSMLRSMGEAIIDAQQALDANSIQQCRKMAGTKVSLHDAQGGRVSKSLLDLGLLPSFYHFTEANLELSIAMSVRTEEASSVKLGISASAAFGQSSSESTSTGETAADTGTTSTTETTSQSTTKPTTTGTTGTTTPTSGTTTTGTSTSTTTEGPTGAAPDKSSSSEVMFGMSLNVENSRKFNFDASGAAKIKAKLVSVPLPSVFLDAMRANAAGSRAAA